MAAPSLLFRPIYPVCDAWRQRARAQADVSAETLSGETLSGETLSGETLSGETLSGETLSADTPPAGEPEPNPEPDPDPAPDPDPDPNSEPDPDPDPDPDPEPDPDPKPDPGLATTALISASRACLAPESRNEARTPFAASSASWARFSPSTEAARRYSSVSVVPNIGGSSLFSVTNRPSASSRGSGCAARPGTCRVHAFDVGHTSKEPGPPATAPPGPDRPGS